MIEITKSTYKIVKSSIEFFCETIVDYCVNPIRLFFEHYQNFVVNGVLFLILCICIIIFLQSPAWLSLGILSKNNNQSCNDVYGEKSRKLDVICKCDRGFQRLNDYVIFFNKWLAQTEIDFFIDPNDIICFWTGIFDFLPLILLCLPGILVFLNFLLHLFLFCASWIAYYTLRILLN